MIHLLVISEDLLLVTEDDPIIWHYSHQEKTMEYGVKAIAAYSGINAHTIRIWERRYGAIKPSRSSNGRRVYSQLDAERLCLIAALTAQGHAISSVAQLSLAELEKLVTTSKRGNSASAPKQTSPNTGAPLDTNNVTSMLLDRLVDALENYQLKSITHQLSLARMHCSVADFVYHIVLPIIGRMGKMVAEDKLSIAHEHALSAILKTHIYQTLLQLSSAAPQLPESEIASTEQKKKLVIATQEGDYHEFGILLASVIAESQRIPTFYFGCNIPARSLVSAANALGSSVILLGRAIRAPVVDATGRTVSQKEYLKELDQNLIATSEIWVGGVLEQNAFRFRPRHKLIHVPSLEQFSRLLSQLHVPS
jgi:MerR family transcriptional regulator, light-induced transcriptional regulator